MQSGDIDDPRVWRLVCLDGGCQIENMGTYLDDLDELVRLLPVGSAALVTEAGHFGYGERCMHDMSFEPRTLAGGSPVRFWGNPFKHDQDIQIVYTGHVETAFIDRDGVVLTPAAAVARAEAYSYLLGGVTYRTPPSWSVWIDQVFPTGEGCVHRLVCDQGVALVRCGDLSHQWVPDWTSQGPRG